MAFQDDVAATLAGNGQAPSNAQAPSGDNNSNPESAMMPNQPTAPATTGAPSATPAPATPQQTQSQPQPQPERPEAPGEHFRNLSHALKGAVLSVLAGGKPVVDGYDVDSAGKTTPRYRQMTGTERLQEMARAALIGLAAGSRVPSGPNRAAQLAAGIGAGAGAQMERAQQQDLLKRQQAQEGFETQEKAKLDNAIRANHLASTFSLYSKAIQEQQDHDPERQKNLDLVNSARDYIQRNPGTSLKVDVMPAEQATLLHQQEVQALANDPSHSTPLSTAFPVGMKAATDESGNPLFEQDGRPKMIGQVGVLSGGENMPVPQSFIDDLKEYGKQAGISGADKIQAGQEYPVLTILNWDSRMNKIKQAELDPRSWEKIKRADGTEVLMSTTGKVREVPPSSATATGTPNMDVIEKELNQAVPGDRAAQLSAALNTVLQSSTASAQDKVRAKSLKDRADAQASAAVNFAGRKSGAESKAKLAETGQDQQRMWEEGRNPVTGEKLNLSNAPDTMMVDHNGQPIPFKMLATMKPTQQENNRADFAKSTLHILDIIDGLRQQGKLPNGPISGLTAETLAGFGFGSDSQKALNLIKLGSSAATGAHVGGRFNQEIMKKMDTLLNMRMNDEQFTSAEEGIRDVMKPYAEQGGRLTVGEYKADLLGRTPQGEVAVQIPGQEPGFVPKERVKDFKAKHPNAVILQ